jgi:hypothetical protein
MERQRRIQYRRLVGQVLAMATSVLAVFILFRLSQPIATAALLALIVVSVFSIARAYFHRRAKKGENNHS